MSLIFFLIFLVGCGLATVIRKSIEASDERKIAEEQATALLAKQTNLTDKIAALNTPEGQEAALREQFPVVKDGEHVVVITDPDEAADAAGAMPATSISQTGFWNFLKNIFHL